MTTLDMSLERASITIDGTPYEVVELRGEEALSTLFRFDVVCAATESDPLPAELVGRAASITLRDGLGVSRGVHGIVASAESRVYDNGKAKLAVAVRPAVYPISLGRDSYILHDVDIVDIIKDVLFEFKGPVRYDVTRSYPKRIYTAQYREDDWTFLSRLLEEEGIYYWFDHRGDDTTLVFSDSSSAAPDIEGGALIPFAYESGMTSPTELVQELASETQATSKRFTVASFDPARPAFKVGATVGEGPLEIYHARGGNPVAPSVCDARARTMQESAAAARSTNGGLSSSVRLVPGMIFELADHPLAKLDGSYFITETRVSVVQRRRGVTKEDSKPYECHFRAIHKSTPYRAPQDTPPGKQAGLQTGVVVGPPGAEIYPDDAGRVRVQLHWDRVGKRDDAAGKWMRVAQRGTASSMLLPRTGWTVLSFNEEGSIDAPNVLSRIFDGEHRPPYSLPANKTRVVFKTATTPGGGSFNEIYFEDTLGAEEMFINASRDMNAYVQNLKNEYIFNDARRDVGGDHDLSIADHSVERVARNQTVKIGGDESVASGQERDKTVGGNETVTIGGSRTLRTGQGHEDQITHDRKLKVGAALIDTTLGGVSAIAKNFHTMLAGGAALKISQQSITEEVGTTALQMIGGVKIEVAKTERALDVRKKLTETVGGFMMLTTNKRYLDHANTKSSWVVAGKATATAPEVWIEAKDKIELRCGGSTIVVLPDSVEIKATSFDLTQAAHLEAKTNTIEHN